MLLTRLIRRYTAERTDPGTRSCRPLAEFRPRHANATNALASGATGLARSSPRHASTETWLEQSRQHEFAKLLLDDWHSSTRDLVLTRLAIALQFRDELQPPSLKHFDKTLKVDRRVASLGMLNFVNDQLPSRRTPGGTEIQPRS